MDWVDTHTHIYMLPTLEERDACLQRSLDEGVSKVILGGVDRASIDPIKSFCLNHPLNVFPTIGLHPTDVKENFRTELDFIEKELSAVQTHNYRYVGVGETGLDFYTERTFEKEQEEAFRIQISWAKKYKLPLVLHIRSAFDDACKILKEEQDGSLRGVFHCFGGNSEQAKKAIDFGFYVGIGGVITFKNAHLAEALADIDIKHIVLETDAPYLAPHPFRGQTNESSYIPIIGRKLAEVKSVSVSEAASVTTQNAVDLFGI